MPYTYTLSYVNEKEKTAEFDADFSDIVELFNYVDRNHPKWTSYQIIATRRDRNQLPPSEGREVRGVRGDDQG